MVITIGTALNVMALVKYWNALNAGECIIHIVSNLQHQSLCVQFARWSLL